MVLELGGASVLRRCRGTAWRSTAERDGGGARVDRVPGVRPGVFKGGRAGIAVGRRGIRIPATSPVISGPLRSRERREEEGADARGRMVSGCDAGLLGARGADRWGRRLRRVARGASPDVERASRAERGAERWAAHLGRADWAG